MGKFKKWHSGMKQTREPPDFYIYWQVLILTRFIKSGDQRPLEKRGETEKPNE